jgi:uncharacterized membrane protein
MTIKSTITIQGILDDVYAVFTDIEGAEERLSGVDKIEILENGRNGLIGLKWREVRTLFGKQAEEVMWVTAAKDNEFYEVEARSHGMHYLSRYDFQEAGDKTNVTMTFTGKPRSIGAVLISPIGLLFKGATRKALDQDLTDLKAVIESDTN